MGNTAGVHDKQVGFDGPLGLVQTMLLQQFSYLLAFVLIDFAAKSINGKSPHTVV